MSASTYFILCLIGLSSVIAFYSKRFYYTHLLYPYGMMRMKDAYPIFTSHLIHQSFLHLAFNFALIFIFGVELENQLAIRAHGRYLVVLVWWCSSMVGTLCDLLLYRQDSQFYSCGASSGAMGVMAAYLWLDHDFNLQFLREMQLNVRIILPLLIVLTIWKIDKRKGRINYGSHAGGLLTGLGMSVILN
ncbi:rhomboid family intramembrane serine protease [Pedobacter alpinus]|uniref:Rhomboid family intramembrane serine protease n=1 Tax=Pedobacter alpinus TaxID=1590643 RepID=A0ABW5TNG1_9SPHI